MQYSALVSEELLTRKYHLITFTGLLTYITGTSGIRKHSDVDHNCVLHKFKVFKYNRKSLTMPLSFFSGCNRLTKKKQKEHLNKRLKYVFLSWCKCPFTVFVFSDLFLKQVCSPITIITARYLTIYSYFDIQLSIFKTHEVSSFLVQDLILLIIGLYVNILLIKNGIKC